MRLDLSIRILSDYFANAFREKYCALYIPGSTLFSMLLFDHHLFIMLLSQLPFFFDDNLNSENGLYIIKCSVIIIMIMGGISLRGNVGNNGN